jgi:hypothetical protein
MTKSNLGWGAEEITKGWKGLNNAAINSFNSNIINSFVREMFQNSIDARDKTLPKDPTTRKIPPLRISINYKRIRQSQFPDFNGFVDIFARIKSAELNAQHVEFFKDAAKAMGNRDALMMFVYEDFNTTGLSGSDSDDNSSFSGCVLSEGISIGKEKTSGGSYGIGKNAIFGFSKLRTVFYSSYNRKNEFIFQGIAKLASYIGKDKKKYSDRIFCGSGTELKSIRKIEDLNPELQEMFRRSEPGLSQYAVCPSNDQNWVEEFARAILRNYWMLLEKGELIVELKEANNLQLKIEKSNLEELFKRYFDPETFEPDDNIKPSGNPYEFYSCYKTGKSIETNIDLIGKVRFFYKELENSKTNAIAYLRNDMTVYSQAAHSFSTINYCGVFICDNEDGNAILRDMEPPTHDLFSPERLGNKSEIYSVKDGTNILNGIKKIVRDALQSIADKYKKAAEDILFLDDLLSSITGAAGTGSGNRMNIESEKESIERMGAKLKVSVSMPSLMQNTVVNDDLGNVKGTGGGSGGGTGGGRGYGNRRTGKGGKGGGVSGTKESMKTKIQSRIFRTTQLKDINGVKHFGYKMLLNSEKKMNETDILISQKGDSGNVVSFEISEIKNADGTTLNFSKENNSEGEASSYRLKSVPIPCELILFVNEPYKSSFKIVRS